MSFCANETDRNEAEPTLGDWQRAIGLLEEHVQLAAEDQRAFEDRVCSEPAGVGVAFEALRRADVHSASHPFLAPPVVVGLDVTANAGTRLGAYQLAERIAEGGTGVVFRAQRVQDYEQTVAIKVLLSPFPNSRAHARFHAERQALAKLNNPHICRLLDAGETDQGAPYLVMELIEGGPIDTYCRTHDVSMRQRVAWMLDVCQAVTYAHERGILHRDLKPSNILVDNMAQVRVTDFGIAKFVSGKQDDASTANSARTMTGEILGTPGYMAPEQAFGQTSSIGPATDVYGLGGVLYALLVGQAPFRGDSLASTLLMIREREPVEPRLLDRSVPTDLQTVCLKCLAKEPKSRYTSVEALREDLRRHLAGLPVLARPVGPIERLYRWVKRQPALAALSGILVGVIGAALIVLSVLLVAANTERAEALRQRSRARAAVDKMFTETSRWLADQPHSSEIRQKLLLAARDEYEQLTQEQTLGDRALEVETATAWYRLGKIEAELGDHQGRSEAAKEALARFEVLAEKYPDHHEYQFDVFQCQFLAHDITNAYETIRQLASEAPDPDGKYRSVFCGFTGAYVRKFINRGRNAALQEMISARLDLADQLQREFPTSDDLRTMAHELHGVRAELFIAESDFELAAQSADRALQLAKQRARDLDDDVGISVQLQRYLQTKVAAQLYGGDSAGALETATEAVEISRAAAEARSTSAGYANWHRQAAAARLAVFLTSKDTANIHREEQAYVALLERNVAQFPMDTAARVSLADWLVWAQSTDLQDRQRAMTLIESLPTAEQQSLTVDFVKVMFGDFHPLLERKGSTSHATQVYVAYAEALAGQCEQSLERLAVLGKRHPSPILMWQYRRNRLLDRIDTMCDGSQAPSILANGQPSP